MLSDIKKLVKNPTKSKLIQTLLLLLVADDTQYVMISEWFNKKDNYKILQIITVTEQDKICVTMWMRLYLKCLAWLKKKQKLNLILKNYNRSLKQSMIYLEKLLNFVDK